MATGHWSSRTSEGCVGLILGLILVVLDVLVVLDGLRVVAVAVLVVAELVVLVLLARDLPLPVLLSAALQSGKSERQLG